MRRAGKTAMNARRYYLKCPANFNHRGSFIWCDEYIRGMRAMPTLDDRGDTLQFGKERAHLDVGEDVAIGCRHCSVTTTTLDVKTLILIGFLGSSCLYLEF